MKKVLWIALAMAVAAPSLEAGAPPQGGQQGGRQGGRRGGPGGGFFGQPGGGGPRAAGSGLFGLIEGYFQLTPEQHASLDKLADQREVDQTDGITQLNKTLDTKYLALIAEVLPAEEKAKFEKAGAAMVARDEAIAAAQKELREALDKVRISQGVERSAMSRFPPFGKTDIVRRYLKLDEAQHTAIDGAARESANTVREKMRDVPRPQDWRDEAARTKYLETMRKVRDEVDTQVVKDMLNFLTADQKTAYQTGADALDVANKKIKEANETYENTLIEVLGAMKPKAPGAEAPVAPATPVVPATAF